MPRISKVNWPKMKLDYGWQFDIQSYEDLQGWWDNVRTNISQKDFSQAMLYKEGKAHSNILAQLSELWGLDLISSVQRLQIDIGTGLDKTLQGHGRIFINNVGGYYGYHTGLKVTETKQIDVWALPNEKIRIISWPDGSHFYAKIGNEDIVWQGKQKWNTHYEAEQAANAYMKDKKR